MSKETKRLEEIIIRLKEEITELEKKPILFGKFLANNANLGHTESGPHFFVKENRIDKCTIEELYNHFNNDKNINYE